MSRWLDKEIIKVLDRLGKKISKKFGYQYSSIKRLHPNDELYHACCGYCDLGSKDIRIKIKRNKNEFYSIEYLVDTLIHEIAHTSQGPNDETANEGHDADWKSKYREMRDWVKRNIYE